MGYWSDEREDLKNTIRLINQTALNRAKENAELREEIEGLKMKRRTPLQYIVIK